nr:NADH dehydrogenase subunit 6 [Strongylura marina]
MTFVLSSLLFVSVMGLVAVASNPSPYFAALGLVVVAGVGCGVLVNYGVPFLSLVLFLIYLGGMLVVFAYSAALAAEPYPESFGSWPVLSSAFSYLTGVSLIGLVVHSGWYDGVSLVVDGEVEVELGGRTNDMSALYEGGGFLLGLCGTILGLALCVVLELTRVLDSGMLCVV